MINEILAKQLKAMNLHLAEKRKNLKDLVKEEIPRLYLRDGSLHFIKKEELQKLCDILSEEEQEKLLIPIYIELSAGKYGKGTARILGKIECKAIGAILGKSTDADKLFVYKHEVKKIRKALPTTTQYMFSL
jgi:hypothetical protein